MFNLHAIGRGSPIKQQIQQVLLETFQTIKPKMKSMNNCLFDVMQWDIVNLF